MAYDSVPKDATAKFPVASKEVQNAVTQVIEAVQVLEDKHPILTSYAEAFIEVLMNVLPSDGERFRVNPMPIVDFVVLDEDNEFVGTAPSSTIIH